MCINALQIQSVYVFEIICLHVCKRAVKDVAVLFQLAWGCDVFNTM